MKISLTRMIFVLLVLGMASLACNLPTGGSPTRPPVEPTLASEDLQNLEESLKATLQAADQSKEVTLTVTQQQLNSFLLAEMEGQTDQPFTDPQVVLTNGQMEIYGKVSQSGIVLDSKIVLQPRINESGEPKLDVVSVDVGPFPAPDSMKNQVGAVVDNTLRDYIAAQGNGFTVTSITITEGAMTITGVQKQP